MAAKGDGTRLIVDVDDGASGNGRRFERASDGSDLREPRSGDVLGGCRLDAVIGRGAMGITYRARD